MRHIALPLALVAALAAWFRPAPQISGDVREFLAGIEMIDMDTGNGTVRVARYTGTLQIVNGSGSTYLANGTGNLLLGYAQPWLFTDRQGSHNLVVGDGHNWTVAATGGVVAGHANYLHGNAASILGGENNQAGGRAAVVVGGGKNDAAGAISVVGGGYDNEAFGFAGSTCGGTDRASDGDYDWSAGSLWQDD